MRDKESLLTGKDFWLFGLLFLFVLIWFHNVVIYDNILSYGDLGQYFYPIRQFSTDSIKGGSIPLWNPYLRNGAPFLATLQACIFYPVSIVYYLFSSFDHAFNWYIILHFLLAGIFMYLLMRYWKATRPASFISSLVFAFGGYLSSVINMNTSLSSAIWLPVILLFFDMAIKRRSLFFALITSLFLGFQFLGGEPTIIYCTIWFLFFYALSLSCLLYKQDRDLKALIKIWGLFLAAVTFWIFITMAQLLPFIELLLRTTRAATQGFEFVTHWSLRPGELVTFFIPFALGNITVPGGHLNIQEWMTSFYIGILPLIFLIAAIIIKPSKKTIFFTFLLILSLLLAMGRYTPLYRFLHRYVFGFGHIRYPIKFIFLSGFALSILAGLGCDKFLKVNDERMRDAFARRLILFNGSLALALVLFLRFWKEIYSFLIKFSLFERPEIFNHLHGLSVVYLSDSAHICRFFIIFTLSALTLILYLTRRIRFPVFILLASAIVFFDLASVNMGISKAVNRELFKKEPPSFLAVKEDKAFFRIMRTRDILELNKAVWGMGYGIGQHERKVTFDGNIPMQYGIHDAQGYGSLSRKDRKGFMDLIYKSERPFELRLIDLLNVKYVISTELLEDKRYNVVYQGDVARFPISYQNKMYMHFYINRNNNCMDRAFLVEGAQVAADRDEILDILKSRDFNPAKVVILEEEPILINEGSGDVKEERAEIISYRPEEVVISVSVRKPKFLILSDSYYPGWKVLVNGRPDKLYRADYFLRAVYLDRGEHEVAFIFDPLSYKIGRYVSLASIAFLIVFTITAFWKRRLQYSN
jgi:hypothetical protein